MKKYYVIDLYEEIECLLKTDLLCYAVTEAKIREEDTDGECDVIIYNTTKEKDLYTLRDLGII